MQATEIEPQSNVPDIEPPLKPDDTVKHQHSKVGATWVALTIFVLLLLLLVIFILQNSMTVRISYLGAHGHLAFGVALLIAAIAGSLLTILIGTVRIVQLKFSRSSSKH